MRFIDSIDGLNTVFETDIPKKSIVMITGEEGTVKSGFTYALLSNYLERSGEYGLYITLEQNKESHLANMGSMGIASTKNLVISDISEYRMNYSDENVDIIDLLGKSIIMYKRKLGDKFTCIAIDSLGALYSLINVEPHELRRKLYHLFESIRTEGITAFIIFEKADAVSENQATSGMEGYIADGVIELGMIIKGDNAMRHLRVRKMRAAKHSMSRHIFMIGDSGIKIVEGMVFD